MLDDAVRLVADLDRAAEDSYVRAHAKRTWPHHRDQRHHKRFSDQTGEPTAPARKLIDAAAGATTPTSLEIVHRLGADSPGATWMARRRSRDMNASTGVCGGRQNTDTREHGISDIRFVSTAW